MVRNKLRWTWYISAVAVLCLISVLMYLFIVSSDFSYIYKDIIHASSDVLIIVCAYVVVDAIAFAIGYGMLQKLNMLVSVKFVVYLAVVVLGNLLIVFLLSPVASLNFLHFVIAVFILLVFLNFAISEIFFEVGVQNACFIGMLIGLINALMGIMMTPVCR